MSSIVGKLWSSFGDVYLSVGISMKKFNYVLKPCERFQMKENAIWWKVHLKFSKSDKRFEIWLVVGIKSCSRRDISFRHRFRHLYSQNPYRQNSTNFMILIVYTCFTGNKKIRTLQWFDIFFKKLHICKNNCIFSWRRHETVADSKSKVR